MHRKGSEISLVLSVVAGAVYVDKRSNSQPWLVFEWVSTHTSHGHWVTLQIFSTSSSDGGCPAEWMFIGYCYQHSHSSCLFNLLGSLISEVCFFLFACIFSPSNDGYTGKYRSWEKETLQRQRQWILITQQELLHPVAHILIIVCKSVLVSFSLHFSKHLVRRSQIISTA